MKLAIIAGGKGTRLGLKDIPKPMVQIGNAPLLQHQITNARKYGITEIYLLVGHLSEVIEQYFGDGSAFGVKITYIKETRPMGTAGAVKQLENIMHEQFLVFYGDVLFDLDLRAFMDFDSSSLSIATVIVHPNDHPYDSDLLGIDDQNIVTAFYPKPHDAEVFYRNLVNAAVYILNPRIFQHIPCGEASDFGKDIFPTLVKRGERITAYNTAEYLKDIGTPDRLKKASEYLLSGRIERASKRYKQPAVFLDRDGTLIEDIDLLHKADDLILYPFAAEAIKKLNDAGILCFVVTNQPMVARNLCDISDVHAIHNKMETLIGMGQAYVNNIYFCPHHPDKGYPEENLLFKIRCDCRKPATGMILRAVEEYNVDIETSWIIGDTTTDIQTGKNSGLRTILVRTGKAGKDGKHPVVPDCIFDNVKDAVEHIITKYR